ncbi:MAG: hypothetical protein K2K57_04370 [Oscillospiraceae bacterium]|nr:hypothetical protein [Oscillospiraceae bacterium]
MGNYIKAYMKAVDAAIEKDDTDFETLKREHLVQIGFIQHERIVHLIVTVMCCLLLFLGLGIFFISGLRAIMAVNVILLVLVFSYLMYYCFIENRTQQMYRQYNRICKRLAPDDPLINSLFSEKPMIK